jgi:hypothetical protein
MKDLGFELPEWCVPPSEAMVHAFESRFSLDLPNDYREFLLHHGGKFGDARCAFSEPTPCGPATRINAFYGFTSSGRRDNVVDRTGLIEGAPDVIAIGGNQLGAMFWLKCTGKDAGHVYMHDGDGRSAWSDAMFYEWFPNLSPDIEQYLKLRKQGILPKKPKGYEHLYRLAESFGELIDRLERTDE